jgi:transposase
MPRPKSSDAKTEALRSRGCLHPRPQDVTDPLFSGSDFFDARDVVQVKYEMLRRTRVDRLPISASAAAAGFSRPTFYEAQAAFGQKGVEGLVPAKPGPRRAHKLSEEVVDFLEKAETARPAELADLVHKHFGRTVHPRSIERALARREEKRQRSPR